MDQHGTAEDNGLQIISDDLVDAQKDALPETILEHAVHEPVEVDAGSK